MTPDKVTPRREPVALREVNGKEPPSGFFEGFDEAGEPTAQPDPWSAIVQSVPVDWYTTPPPPRTWLLRDARKTKADGVFPLGKCGQLIAEGGAGKTMLLAQLAVAVATGTRFLGAFDVASPGRVLLALGEEDAEEVRRRLFRAVRASHAPNPPEGSIVVLPLAGVPCAMLERDDRGNLVEASFAPFLRARLALETDWRLVVVDPLSRFAGPDAETDNAAGTRFMQALESLAPAAGGASVLNAHHTNKLSRGKGQVDGAAGRGSSALFDGARWQCSLGTERLELDDPEARERLGEVVTFAITKSNYSRKADRVLLRRDLDNGGALVPVDDADLETVTAARRKDPQREARTVAREAEREQSHATRQRLAEERRSRETAAKVAEGEARRRAADRALVAVLRERPGITGDELRSALAARLDGCSRQRMQDTVARLGAAVVTGKAPGKGHGTTHRLEEVALPEQLR